MLLTKCLGLFLVAGVFFGSSAQQNPMCHLNLGNLMDVQERHITNRKCRDYLVILEDDVSWWGSFSKYQMFLLASTRLCYPLSALIREDGSKLCPNSFSWISIGGGPYPITLPILNILSLRKQGCFL
ncbi:hypothetical protein J6590_070374 [Homalodisca vitripennis]|nr:hypothetical protein J6590_070374 [Homalodisca vitripennis]